MKTALLSDHAKETIKAVTITMLGIAAVMMTLSILTGTPSNTTAFIPALTALHGYTAFTLLTYWLGDTDRRRTLPLAQVGTTNMAASIITLTMFPAGLTLYTAAPTTAVSAAVLWALLLKLYKETHTTNK